MTDSPVFDRIKQDISANDVVLFMKGSKKNSAMRLFLCRRAGAGAPGRE